MFILTGFHLDDPKVSTVLLVMVVAISNLFKVVVCRDTFNM